MSQYEHCVRRTTGKTMEYVEVYNGRGTTTMPIEEFLAFAEHIAVVAAGAQESHSIEYTTREADYTHQRDPKKVAERARGLLTALGLAKKPSEPTFKVL